MTHDLDLPKQSPPISLERELQLVLLLMTYLASGLLFLVLPGTFLGVWNLFAISEAHSATSVSASWIQAHGHAQIFGWIGTFILGIGFYSIPNLRRVSAWSWWDGWLIWSLWTVGAALRWLTNVYGWNWQVMLPLSAALELAAVVIFLVRSTQGHRMQRRQKDSIEAWAILVIGGTIGLLSTMAMNLYECISLSQIGASSAFPASFNSSFLVLSIWSFPVLIAWGFTAHWMPVFMGLRPLRSKLMLAGFVTNIIGVCAAIVQAFQVSAIVLFVSAVLIITALRMFEPSEKPPKTQGVHRSFPVFMRAAYAWLLAASALAIWAAFEPAAAGIGGAGRHAITVGYLMTMVFSVAPRMMPAFLGRKKLFSESLMFIALVFVNVGCFLRVSSEILAYQQIAQWAWIALPVSATLELTGVVIFSINMIGTFRQPPLLGPQSRCAPATQS